MNGVEEPKLDPKYINTKKICNNSKEICFYTRYMNEVFKIVMQYNKILIPVFSYLIHILEINLIIYLVLQILL